MYSDLLINNLIDLYGKSKLTESISYQLSTLSDVDNNIIYIVESIQNYCNIKFNKEYTLINVALALIYMYNSQIILFNLPHMLDKINYNNKPCLHVFLGETITQLTSIALLTECFEIIHKSIEVNKNIKNKNILELSTNSKLTDELIISLGNDDKKIYLNKLLDRDIYSVYYKAINISLNFYTDNDVERNNIIKELELTIFK